MLQVVGGLAVVGIRPVEKQTKVSIPPKALSGMLCNTVTDAFVIVADRDKPVMSERTYNHVKKILMSW